MKSRRFLSGVVNHCYQRTADHFVLFYSVRDHLVFFTVFCVMAQRHGVHVLKLVQMPDHTHHASITETLEQLTAFTRDYTAVFAKEYNRAYHLSGPVFETPFGSAPKRSDKDIRSLLIYLDNNPVERHLVEKAESYRWNYLRYSQSPYPFSDSVLLRNASMPLRRALDRVRRLHGEGKHLTYPILNHLFDTIPSKKEKEQLTDFIVSTYSVIDHEASFRNFDGYEQELLAAQSTTGSEFDIREGFIGKSDKYYAQFTNIILESEPYKDIHEVLNQPEEEKQHLLHLLKRKTRAPWKQIAAFLHLPLDCLVLI